MTMNMVAFRTLFMEYNDRILQLLLRFVVFL